MSNVFTAQIKIENEAHLAKIQAKVTEVGGTLKECRNPQYIWVELPWLYRDAYIELLSADKEYNLEGVEVTEEELRAMAKRNAKITRMLHLSELNRGEIEKLIPMSLLIEDELRQLRDAKTPEQVFDAIAYDNAVNTHTMLTAHKNRGQITFIPTLSDIVFTEREKLQRRSTCGVCHNPCPASNMVSVTSEVDDTTGMATREVTVCPSCIESMELQQRWADDGAETQNYEIMTHLGLERQ